MGANPRGTRPLHVIDAQAFHGFVGVIPSTGHISRFRGSIDGYRQLKWRPQDVNAPQETLGFLLDMDVGCLTVYRHGKREGVIETGLSGEELRWTVLLHLPGHSGTIVARVPPTLTAEEEKQQALEIAEVEAREILPPVAMEEGELYVIE